MYKDELKANLVPIALIIAIGGILALLGNFIVSNFNNKVYAYEQSLTQTIYIKSISVTDENGDYFTLGRTTDHTKQYYVCYEEMEDGCLKVHEFESKKTVFNNTLSKDEKPYAEVMVNDYGEILKVKLYLPKSVKQVEYDSSILFEEQLRGRE